MDAAVAFLDIARIREAQEDSTKNRISVEKM
jgi:hypothetical protein